MSPVETSVVRVDRYTITVDGHRVTAGEDLERRIRAMTTEQQAALVKILGGGIR